MMSLTFGLFTQVSGSGPLGPLVMFYLKLKKKKKDTKKLSQLDNIFGDSAVQDGKFVK